MSTIVKAEELVKDLITSDKFFKIEYDSSQTVKGLTKIPLISKNAFQGVPQYQLLQEAQKEGSVKIKETGIRTELEILNQSQYPVFIPCGSLFISQEYGKQDRCAITDLMVDKGEKTEIPVVCIEKGRWSDRSDDEVNRILGSKRLIGSDFYSNRLATVGVLEAMSSSTTRYLIGPYEREGMYRHTRIGMPLSERRARFQANQSQVWREVDKEIEQADAKTPTSSLTEVHLKKEKEAKVEFEIYENEIGNIFAGEGRVLAMELYNSPKSWQSMSEETIKRYKMSINSEKEPKKDFVNNFLSDLSKCKPVAVESIGMGYDVRLTEGKADGSCLVVNQAPIHFTAIPSAGRKGRASQMPDRIPLGNLLDEIYRNRTRTITEGQPRARNIGSIGAIERRETEMADLERIIRNRKIWRGDEFSWKDDYYQNSDKFTESFGRTTIGRRPMRMPNSYLGRF
jgi:hypothetical protein